jgi:RHS repeat-associated protein
MPKGPKVIPVMLGLGSLIAKAAAVAVIPRVIQALSALGGPTEPVRANPSEPTPETVSAPVQQSKKVLYKKYPLTDHSYRYSTYGERTKVGGDLDSDWGYAGLFHHGPSGLDLATYRVYDSKMGRWISRDPLGEGVDYNLYRYCGNDPISNVDPLGLVTNKNPFPSPSGKRKPVGEEEGSCGPTREGCEERRERKIKELGGSPTPRQWDEIWKDYWDCLKMVFEYERDYEIERRKKPGYNPYRDPRHPENFDHERALQYDRGRRP